MASKPEQITTSSADKTTGPPSPVPLADPLAVVGTRKSLLARIQTDLAIRAVEDAYPEYRGRIGVKGLDPLGDRDKVTPLWDFTASSNEAVSSQVAGAPKPSQSDAKGLWTEELEELLEKGEVDFVVHSLKDIPTTLPPQFTLAAILKRADARDALVVHPELLKHLHATGVQQPSLSDLPKGSIVGTSSLRRSAQLLRAHVHLQFEPLRGNVPTRLRKLDESVIDIPGATAPAAGTEDTTESAGTKAHPPFSAIIIATAGLDRLSLSDRITSRLSHSNGGMLHAVGQGAIGIEARAGDARILKLLEAIACKQTTLACTVERALLRTLEGGCSVPIGVETRWVAEGTLHVRASVVSVDGTEAVETEETAQVETVEEAEALGSAIAGTLRDQGAQKILEKIIIARR
ncbi:porphobilinogen deaminase [Eremomyces bilateralis CBS 781.70]|uniref:hydroxymethylbilane synthase n=1 Tax=Eremomyces bilateralis CBS 781.70 TaxID=1392243 RepID=A0A6G1GB66_9PEZI|nr:porphobilinogen deaminase [Eremomyces bilateralis CBS 781.70]KAF1815315.1 porphobilinogen deaminase [Eremomyces bilateralis CBS 781.70]